MWNNVVRWRGAQWRGQGHELEGGPCGVRLGGVGEKSELYIVGKHWCWGWFILPRSQIS